MKRLFTVLTLCATTLIAASADSGPVAADGRHDGRHDGRRHAGQADRQMSWNNANRGEHRQSFRHDRKHRKSFRHDRKRRHHKFRRHHRRHPSAHGHAYGHRYVAPPRRHGYRSGSVFAFRLDGGRIILRLD